MKALVKAKAERGIWLKDIDKPEVGHNDVLIKVNRTAICGTDIHIFKWDDWAKATIPVPLAVGHEFSARSLKWVKKFGALKSATAYPPRDTSPAVFVATVAPAAAISA